MPRFADCLVAASKHYQMERLLWQSDSGCSAVDMLAGGATIVIADNVSALIKAGGQVADSDMLLPQPYPPFDRLWLEYALNPPTDKRAVYLTHVGVEAYEEEVLPPGARAIVQREFASISGLSAPGGVVYGFVWWRQNDGVIFGPIIAFTLRYSAEKNLAMHSAMVPGTPTWPKEWTDANGLPKTEVVRSVPIFLMACSLMNCKNVTLNEGRILDRERVRWERMTGRRPLKHYILDLDNAVSTLKSEGQLDDVGLRRALHICRGHFRTYGDTRKLFGKYTGTFWIPNHIKGTAASGEVRKWYSVKPH